MSTIYTYGGKVLVNSETNKWLTKMSTPVDPYNPLGLPEKTMRIQLAQGHEPNYNPTEMVWTEVDSANNIWDVTFNDSFSNQFTRDYATSIIGFNGEGLGTYSLEGLFYNLGDLTSVGALNLVGCTSIKYIFENQTHIVSVGPLNTPNITNAYEAFRGCTSLISVPLFDTSNVTNVEKAFYGCVNVESGALALYQQASSQTTPPESHDLCFENCGSNTVTGAAELAQIPSSWGGNASPT